MALASLEPVSVDATAFIRLDTNSYSVPPRYANTCLTLVADDACVRLLDGSQEVARHVRCWGRRQLVDRTLGRSDAKRHMRAQLAVREALVRTRTRSIALVSALVRREGLRIADGEAESFVKRVAALALPGRLMAEVAPLLNLMLHLNAQIAFLDGVLERLAHEDEQVARLCTVPYVGPVTACAFVSG